MLNNNLKAWETTLVMSHFSRFLTYKTLINVLRFAYWWKQPVDDGTSELRDQGLSRQVLEQARIIPYLQVVSYFAKRQQISQMNFG